MATTSNQENSRNVESKNTPLCMNLISNRFPVHIALFGLKYTAVLKVSEHEINNSI